MMNDTNHPSAEPRSIAAELSISTENRTGPGASNQAFRLGKSAVFGRSKENTNARKVVASRELGAYDEVGGGSVTDS